MSCWHDVVQFAGCWRVVSGLCCALATRQTRLRCRFPKIKEEGWFVILAQEDKGDLLALKRVTVSGTSRVSMVYPAVDEDGSEVENVTLYLLSDSYLGLDQQLRVSENGARAQYIRTKTGQAETKSRRVPIKKRPQVESAPGNAGPSGDKS